MNAKDTSPSRRFMPQRRKQILAELHLRGAVRTSDLSRRLGASVVTVRRDLAVLETQGSAVLVYGGAMRPPPDAAPPDAGPGHEADEHNAIGRAAAGLVRKGTVIGLCGGVLIEALAGQLTDRGDLTVITNSLRVARRLDTTADHPHTRPPTIVLTGGHLNAAANLHGPLANSALRSIRLDAAFLDCDGLAYDSGATAADLTDAQTRHHLFDRAGHHVLLAAPATFGRTALTTFAPISTIHTVVTRSTATGLTQAQRTVLALVDNSVISSE